MCGSRFDPNTYKWSKSSEDCCKELHWPFLSARRVYFCLAIMYDMLHQHISLSLIIILRCQLLLQDFIHYLSFVNTYQLILIGILFKSFVNSIFFFGTVLLVAFYLFLSVPLLSDNCTLYY